MLKNILKNRKCFKLICGAGNEDIDEVKKLVAVYAEAGANFFDICADEKIIEVVQDCLRRIKGNHYLCMSVGMEGDPHLRKAAINQEACNNCGNCVKNCPQHAILEDFSINLKRCIGCGKCFEVCKFGAISFLNNAKPLSQILPTLLKYEIDCIELHSDGVDEQFLIANWKYLNENFDGMLSICLNNFKLSKEKFVELLKKMVEFRQPYSTIIQADGVSMSGFCDKNEFSHKAVEAAKIVLDLNLPVFVIPSGGTNADTTKIAKESKVLINGVAIGSYARKIVYQDLSQEDFWKNKIIFEQAKIKAKKLVDISLKNMC